MHISYRRGRTGLQSRRGEDALLLRQCGQVLRLLQAVAERPFAVHGLARLERCGRQLEVMRHFHGDGDDVYRGAVHEVLIIVERERHTEELAGGVSRFAAAGGQRRDLEVIGERSQSGNVRLRCPPAIRIGADDADSNPLTSTPACFHVSLPQHSCPTALQKANAAYTIVDKELAPENAYVAKYSILLSVEIRSNAYRQTLVFSI